MEEKKFNVGDKVVAIRAFQYIDNPYHYEQMRGAIAFVKKATNALFTTYDYNLECTSGCNEYGINWQKDGRPMYSDRYLFHFQKDKKVIIEKLEDQLKEIKQKIQKKEKEEIERLEEGIKASKEKIKELKQKGNIYKRDFMEERLKEVNEMLDTKLNIKFKK